MWSKVLIIVLLSYLLKAISIGKGGSSQVAVSVIASRHILTYNFIILAIAFYFFFSSLSFKAAQICSLLLILIFRNDDNFFLQIISACPFAKYNYANNVNNYGHPFFRSLSSLFLLYLCSSVLST